MVVVAAHHPHVAVVVGPVEASGYLVVDSHYHRVAVVVRHRGDATFTLNPEVVDGTLALRELALHIPEEYRHPDSS